MAIFNSLGSNFDWVDSFRALASTNSEKHKQSLQDQLEKRFGGQVTLTYKGRQALRLGLQNSGLPGGAKVGINGFTCYVVYQALQQAGYRPVLIDIASDSLHFNETGLVKAHQTNQLDAVIVQNTLGIPCDIESIEKFCQTNRLLLIEDLAHSLGSVYSDGRLTGTVGSQVILSFSQDKTLDAVAGGALIHRLDMAHSTPKFSNTPMMAKLKLKSYPLLSHIIRSTFSIGIGRALRKVLKAIKLLSSPMENIRHFPQSIATSKLAFKRWQNLEDELNHRRQIARVYQQNLPDAVKFKSNGEPVYVRYPIRVSQSAELKNYLKKHGFYLSDTWYDAPLAPAKYLAQTNYQPGQCPNSEAVIQTIVNLPTHQEINENQALRLCREVTTWLKS